jgi:hypothetical protein
LLTGCAGRQHAITPWPTECSPTAPAEARPVEPKDVEALAGRYTVTLVLLSHGPEPVSWDGHLDLSITDTLKRYYVQTLRGYVKRGYRPLAGHFRFVADSLHRAEEVEVEGNVLYLGCRDCMDASPDELRLLAQAPGLVWGLWENPQSGNVRVARGPDDWLPNPAGYYCMRRES